MKRLSGGLEKSGLNFDFVKNLKLPKIPFNKALFLKILLGIFIFLLVIGLSGYFLIARPILNIVSDARDLRTGADEVNRGLSELDFNQVKFGLETMRTELEEFESSYERNTRIIRRLPMVSPYYEDGTHLIAVAGEGIELGDLIVEILEPYAADLGFKTDGIVPELVPAQDRIIMILSLMPEFSPKVSEIADRMEAISDDLEKIDASRYPTSLPQYVERFGVNPNLNVREQILALQSISNEVAAKAPQFESFFNAIPEFLGLNEPKKYLILMANNYELRMSGGFNTYIVVAEFDKGTPQITYSIDTYFIDEGERTRSSILVDRNVPYFLRNYLYLPQHAHRLYARDATSTNPDFPTAADELLNRFWRRDRTLPQDVNGVIQINNDIVVEILNATGPVSTEQYSILTDTGNYVTIPITEFNADNVIENLEDIAGGRLAETIGRKEIIRFLGQALLEKIYSSEATNLVNLTKVILDGLSKKDMMLYSFEPDVHLAFSDLGYSGQIFPGPEGSDYLHVNRSNFGSGKADWNKEGFVTQEISKNVELRDGRAISTVKLTIKNPKRPAWYNITPCCFYNAYTRVYVPAGSQLISVTTSDGQDPRSAEYTDEALNKTFFETFTRQQRETNLDITYVYELPESVNTDNYKIFVQRQSGASIDPYQIGFGGVSQEFLLNADRLVEF